MDIVRYLEKKVNSEDLDELVHEAAAEAASVANNGGVKDQVQFLKSVCGFDDTDILRNLGLVGLMDMEKD